jgi:hypothetical protein
LRRLSFPRLVFVAAALLANASGARADVASSVLQPGSNEGTADSFVGDHNWIFSTKPGHFELDISLGRVPTNALPGAPFTVVLHVVPLAGNHVTFAKTPGGYVYKGDMKTSAKMRLQIIPANSTLVRAANEYTVVASGPAVVFATGADPIIGTYSGSSDGAARILPGGVIKTAGGVDGTWTVFDPQLHVYTITIGQTRYSVKLVPGQGLLDANNGNIVMQAMH